ncbi:MAG TPA: hypothetical protein VGR32_00730 [Brevundimonas sp.]|jgi:hypothetical protein|uniref:hypothetical protein n=1 Tax=Brevundimonas sp. TaxID=1871086 RepID=UPI002DEC2CE3|nr:hypothetical protein [Brevundimonas sp.]
MTAFQPHAAVAEARYMIVPCEGRSSDLAVIWDRLEEQVVDVIDRRAAARWTEEDALWDEGRAAFHAADAEPLRMAA